MDKVNVIMPDGTVQERKVNGSFPHTPIVGGANVPFYKPQLGFNETYMIAPNGAIFIIVTPMVRRIVSPHYQMELIPAIYIPSKTVNRCTCDLEHIEPHTCPMKLDLNHDDSLCTCCSDCEYDCKESI